MFSIKRFFLYLFLSINILAFAQVDNIGPGRVISFDGIDDYADLGNIYDDLNLPITIEAWILLETSVNEINPIFNSQDNLPLYNGVTFMVTPTSVSIQYGDGRGENNVMFRKGKVATIPSITGKWTHVCGIMRGINSMDIYVNGVNVGGRFDGSSDQPMSSSSPGDVAKIGYWLSNGETRHFKGKIDELRFWKRALTETEIRQRMCKKLDGTEADLIGYWDFNEIAGDIIADKSANKFNGQLKGSATRSFSAAPIGDESVFLYPGNWSGVSLEFEANEDHITVKNVTGSPEGIHVYKVNDLPSQTGGLDPLKVEQPYFGVFIAANDLDNYFDLRYLFQEDEVCRAFMRKDNSVGSWIEASATPSALQRTEIIKLLGERVSVDLGADRFLCDQKLQTLTPTVGATSVAFLWSTGETSPEISVSATGNYWVEVSSACETKKDSAWVVFMETPGDFSLGADESLCEFSGRQLRPFENTSGFEFTWQDGSTTPYFDVTDFGTYWVNVKNACGSVSDTIRLSPKFFELDKVPNVITPNDDEMNDYFVISPYMPAEKVSLSVFNRWGQQVHFSENYTDNWNGSGLPNGVYFYMVKGVCARERKGSITIIR